MKKMWAEDSCRICLQISPHNVGLSEIWADMPNQITFQEALNQFSNLQNMSEAQHIPKVLCVQCCSELKQSYRFYLKVQKTNCELRQWLDLFALKEITRVRSAHDLNPSLENEFNEITKDPLEDSDNEPLTDAHLLRTIADTGSDSEDDKPLKELIERAKTNSTTEAYPLYDVVIENDENVTDLLLSPEELIFPKGRFKCKICEKSYFTTVGLKAHLEIHLPAQSKTKKKRIRSSTKNQKPVNKNTEAIIGDMIKKADLHSEQNSNAIEGNAGSVEEDIVNEKSTLPRVPKPKKLFPCQVCGKQMISASKLRYHVMMHTGEKDYLCSMCPKAYSTIYALKHHIRAHTGERPYQCKFCEDRFTRPTTLKCHMRRHTGERPYGCDICGKRFIQHSSMTTHMKLNHMVKTIPCPHCDKKYARQTDLNTHLLSHSGEKPFSCQLCPSRFIRQANLNKHMNQQHSARDNVDAKSHRKNQAKREIHNQNNETSQNSTLSHSSIIEKQENPSNFQFL